MPVVRSTPTAVPPPGTPEPRPSRGVKLAKISRTGDRVFGGLAGGSGICHRAAGGSSSASSCWRWPCPACWPTRTTSSPRATGSSPAPTSASASPGLLWTTVLSSVLAMVMAVPVAVGVALCLTQYLPSRVSGPVSFVVDLLAAVPSIIFGLWGLTVLGPFLAPAGDWIGRPPRLHPAVRAGRRPQRLGLRRLGRAGHHDPADRHRASRATSSHQTPRDQIEAALALGATRWEVIRTSVLPYGRSGVISASMLGLGRALGETIAVLIILPSPAPGSAFTPVDLRRRRDLRQQDRQQRRRVRHPVQDRRLHRRRPGAVRRHLRGERRRPDHRRPRSGQVMSAATNTDQPSSSFRRPSGSRTVKNALATVYVVPSPPCWPSSRWSGCSTPSSARAPGWSSPPPGGCRASAASPPGARAAAPTTPSSARSRSG